MKKSYGSYIWEELTVNGGINKLTVSELEKYLSHHNLPKYGKKIDKIKRISCHVCRSNSGREKVQSLIAAQQPRIERSSNGDTNSDVSSSDSEDEVGEEFGSSDDTSSDTSSDELQLTTTTRSGRVAGSWKNASI